MRLPWVLNEGSADPSNSVSCLLEAARKLGCRLGVLFSSAMAEPMYAALGFHRYGTGHCYVWSPNDCHGDTTDEP